MSDLKSLNQRAARAAAVAATTDAMLIYQMIEELSGYLLALGQGGVPRSNPVMNKSKQKSLLVEAVTAAAAEHTSDRAPIRAARNLFYGLMGDAQSNAKRMAWCRALKRAITSGEVAVDEKEKFLWIADQRQSDDEAEEEAAAMRRIDDEINRPSCIPKGAVAEIQCSPERQAILEVLRRAGGPVALADIAEAVQKSSANVSNMLGRMIEGGSVRKAATGRYEIAPPPD